MNQKKELSLREIQMESFKVLKQIKKIFDENGWKYYLAYGTLIGAVRHNGFIPWDDDIDIWVPRPDYELFLNYCKTHKEELKPFEIIHYSTNKKYIYSIARFSNSDYYVDYKNVKNYGLGCFVDLYPLDGYDKKDTSLYKKNLRLTKNICLAGMKKYEKSSSILKTIFKYPLYLVMKKKNISKLLEKHDKLSQKYKYEDSELFLSYWDWLKPTLIYNKNQLIDENSCECFKTFEGEEFRVPADYDGILKSLYVDYMKLPKEEDRIAHHFYSVYKK